MTTPIKPCATPPNRGVIILGTTACLILIGVAVNQNTLAQDRKRETRRKNIMASVAGHGASLFYLETGYNPFYDSPTRHAADWFPRLGSGSAVRRYAMTLGARVEGGTLVTWGTYPSGSGRVVTRRNTHWGTNTSARAATGKRVRFLASGYAAQATFFATINAELRQGFCGYDHAGSCVVSPAPSPLLTHAPQTAGEVPAYKGWLALNLGPGFLDDGWGRPMKATWNNGRLCPRSAGEDGIFGTRDDIVAPLSATPVGAATTFRPARQPGRGGRSG